jgi:hypothetical protein
MGASAPVQLVLVLVNLDDAVFHDATAGPERVDCAIAALGVAQDVDCLRCGNVEAAAGAVLSHLVALGNAPYLAQVTSATVLPRFLSASRSAVHEAEQARCKNTDVDGTQLGQIWISMLRCMPRVSEDKAEKIAARFSSFRSMYDELIRGNARAVAEQVQECGAPGRKESKLARAVHLVMTAHDPNLDVQDA